MNPSEDNQRKPPEEGLNGSNVPGLAPTNAPRSLSSSRRASGGATESASAAPADPKLSPDRNRQSANGSLADLTNAFDRVSVGSGPKASPSMGPTPPPPSSGAVVGGTGANSITGQQSVLQRAINRANMEAQQNGGALSNHAAGEGGGMTPVFNERFLFDDDELEADDSAFVKKYNLNEDDNSFPVLIRRDSHPGMLSASSAALDLAPLSQTPPRFPRANGESQNSNISEWPQFNPRTGDVKGDGARQPSVPAERFDRFNGDRRGQSERNSPRVPSDQGSADSASRGMHMGTSPSTPVNAGRHGEAHLPKSATSARFSAANAPHRLSQGFSEREVAEEVRKEQQRQQQASPQQQRAKDDGTSRADTGFPSFAIDDFTNDGAVSGARHNAGPPSRGFAPYGAGFDGRASSADYSRAPSAYFEAFASPASNDATAGKVGPGNTNSGFGVPPGGTFGQLAGDSLGGAKGAAAANRKGELDANTPLEDLHGEIFALCKDQHGCRYLQKKLEEGVPSYRDIIFTETFSHFAELMTDPFGNYLCQKMLEYCTDEQRNLIVESVAPDLVGISLNMHGTRAVQKTIDFLSTNRQIHSIIVALSMNVVTLIKDLNGNHVIQKCLNRLGAEDNQFIYNAVAAHCVEVATHRHGCCVLQRCIDHASDKQRMQLVQEITYNALTLVQDPFGNYVVQYILDLNDARFSDAVIRQFVGSVCLLSVQKFSSNVIEKCIRVSEPSLRKQLIEELLNRTRLEKLLRDSFANYVVQTSLDYADPMQRMQLVECIKPILPMIRNTPYGKRIQSKLQRDNIDLGGAGPGNASNGNPGHGAGGMSYNMAQAAHQHQLHAMAAMAQRQGPGAASGNGGQEAAYASAMGGANPYGGQPGAMGGGGHPGAGRGYNRSNSLIGGSPLPPPNMYGSHGRPYGHQQGAPGGGGAYGGANHSGGNFNRGGPHAGFVSQSSGGGFPVQSAGFGGNAIPSHQGNVSYNSNNNNSYAPF